jgi:large subunit ribosomal protein L1
MLQVQMILNNMDKKGKARQPVRGSVLLPHATGKKKKLLVLTTDEQQAENALAAGADAVGGKDFVDQVRFPSIGLYLAVLLPRTASGLLGSCN